MEFRILGPLEVVDEGRSLPLGGGRQRALLTALLLRANQVVSTDQLLDEVWSDESPASGVRVVQVYVSQLRKALGEGVIETRPPGYVLVAEPEALDIGRFERLVDEAHGAQADVAAAKLREALALWRGPPLADVAYDAFAQTEIGRLGETSVAVGDSESAEVLYRLLVPWACLNAVDHPEGFRVRSPATSASWRPCWSAGTRRRPISTRRWP
jgi:DNA-binding SARP family transcriptional activator